MVKSIFFTFLFILHIKKMNLEMKKAINYCHTLSKGEKKILFILNDFDIPLSSPHLQDLMNNSKQALRYPLQKLLNKNLVTRKKNGKYLYEINKDGMIPIIEAYRKSLKYKI